MLPLCAFVRFVLACKAFKSCINFQLKSLKMGGIKRILCVDSTHPTLNELLIQSGFEIESMLALNRQEFLNTIGRFDGLVLRSKFQIDEEVIDAAGKCKVIARVGAGMEHIKVKYAESKGIACVHAPEGNRNAVAEHALGMLLMLLNKLHRADREVKQGIWKREENRGEELCGKTVGLIGYGNTGSTFAKRLRGFDIRLLVYDKYKNGFADDFVQECQMEDLFKEADILSLHIPLSDETHHLVERNFLKQFRKPIILLNTSRGNHVSLSDLADAMDNGQVKGAALDVLEIEHSSFEAMEHLPDAFKRLCLRDDVVLSPHIAGWTHQSNVRMAEVLAQKIKKVLHE